MVLLMNTWMNCCEPECPACCSRRATPGVTCCSWHGADQSSGIRHQSSVIAPHRGWPLLTAQCRLVQDVQRRDLESTRYFALGSTEPPVPPYPRLPSRVTGLDLDLETAWPVAHSESQLRSSYCARFHFVRRVPACLSPSVQPRFSSALLYVGNCFSLESALARHSLPKASNDSRLPISDVCPLGSRRHRRPHPRRHRHHLRICLVTFGAVVTLNASPKAFHSARGGGC